MSQFDELIIQWARTSRDGDGTVRERVLARSCASLVIKKDAFAPFQLGSSVSSRRRRYQEKQSVRLHETERLIRWANEGIDEIRRERSSMTNSSMSVHFRSSQTNSPVIN